MMVIVDTNVAVVANGKSEQASEECVDTCIGRLEQIIRGETKLVLDADWNNSRRVLKRNLNSSGKPMAPVIGFLYGASGIGRIPEQCDLVPITPIAELRQRSFKSSRTDLELENFDPD